MFGNGNDYLGEEHNYNDV